MKKNRWIKLVSEANENTNESQANQRKDLLSIESAKARTKKLIRKLAAKVH